MDDNEASDQKDDAAANDEMNDAGASDWSNDAAANDEMNDDYDNDDQVAYFAPISVPGTGGGDLEIVRLFEMTPEVLQQEDRQHNAKMWDLFPLEMSDDYVQTKHLLGQCEAFLAAPDVDGGFYQDDVLRAIPILERARCIGLIWPLMALAAWHEPSRRRLELLRQRKAVGVAAPLHSAVNNALDNKMIMDAAYRAGNYPKALFGYIELLGDLLPWSSSALLFDVYDVYDVGIAQVEGALLVNLAMAATRMAETSPSQDFSGRTLWIAIGMAATDAVLEMRYASHRVLAKAYHYRAKLGLALGKVYNLNASSVAKVHERFKKWDLYANSIYLSRPEDAPDPHDAPYENDVELLWAHRHCITSHSGCLNERMAAARVIQSSMEQVKIQFPWGQTFSIEVKNVPPGSSAEKDSQSGVAAESV